MTFFYGYMGTKRSIAKEIAQAVGPLREGPVLDLFAGMSAVGAEIAPARQVWCNDVQVYAHQVAQSLFVDPAGRDLTSIHHLLQDDYASQHAYLNRKLRKYIKFEHAAIREQSPELFAALSEQLINSRNSGELAWLKANGRSGRSRAMYSAITTAYAGGYFGARQSIEIDAVRYSIQRAFERGEILDCERRRLIIAMGKAMGGVSNSPGHFAQFLRPHTQNISRYAKTRMRSFKTHWEATCRDLQPYGTPTWRRGNRAYNADALSLLKKLASTRKKPGVVYADPPYTADHYSRYYHVLETLSRYDFPDTAGKGMYRPDRYVSQFSIKSKVKRSIASLVDGVADLGADLVISYPENGLLEGAFESIREMLSSRYDSVPEPRVLDHSHSTFGASTGAHRELVREYLFVASGARCG